MASTLLELLVKISVAGQKDVDRALADTEAKAKAADKALGDMGPITEKSSKQTVKSLKPVGEAIGKIKDDHQEFVKGVEDGQKKTDSAFKKMLTGLTSIKDVTTELNKTGVNIKTELQGDKEVQAGLAAIQQAKDSLDRGTITLTMDLENGERVLSELEGVEGVASRIDGDRVVLTIDVDGGPESQAILEAVEASASQLDGDNVRMSIDVDGGPEAIAELEAVDVIRAHLDGNDIRMDIEVNSAEAVTELVAFTAAQTSAGLAAAASSKIFGAQIGVWAALGAAILFATAVITPLLGGLSVLGGLAASAAAGLGLMAGGAVQLGIGLKAIDDANTKVNDSTTKLEAAQQQLADALASGDEEAIAEARKQVESATDGLTKAQANLTAVTEQQGRSTVKLYEAWKSFKAALPGTFEAPARDLAQLGIQLLHIATKALPAVKAAAETTGAAFKAAFQEVLDIFTSDTLKNSFQRLFDAAAPILANLTTAVGKFGAGLINIFAEATPLAIILSEKIDAIAQAFLDWTQSEAGVKQINQAMELAVPVFTALWEAAKNIGAALLEIGVNHGPQVVSFLQNTGEIIQGLITGFDKLWTALSFVADNLELIVATGLSAWILGVIPGVGALTVSAEGLSAALLAGATSAGAFLLALAPLIGLAILIDIAINFDWAAAEQAKTDAEAAGESAGGAYGAGVIAGLEAVPIVGDVVQWIDENLGQPLDNWLTEHSGQFNQAWEAFWAQLGPTAQNSGVKEDIEQIWTDISDSSGTKWQEIYDKISGFLSDIYGAVASYLAPMAPDIASIWDDIDGDTNSEWETIKGYVVTWATEMYNSVATWLAPMSPDIAAIWDDIDGDTSSEWETIKKYVADATKAMYDRVAAALAPMAPEIAKIWDDIDSDTGNTWTDSVKPAVVNACSAVAAAVTGTLGPAIQSAIGWLRDLRTEATSMLNFLGSGLTRGARDTPGTTTNPNAGGPTLQARGGIDEVQGPTGGVSDGLSPRVVYGEQSRRVKEAYIVEDRPDNFPYLVEAASWYGMGLTPMQAGGVLDPTQSGATPTGVADGTVPAFYVVPTPTTGAQLPYTQAARDQYGYMPDGVQAADWVGDHVNVPLGTTSGDPVGGQGGTVSTPWPGLTAISSGGSTASVSPYKSTGPSFAMAAGGTIPGGAGTEANPISYQAVPVNWWDTFLGLAWTGDPAVDWPVLYPPSGWDPSQVYSPAAMKRGGILRGGTRFFQGGGLNQSQIEAGLAAGNSALGAFYSYGSAGEDGGFDCAGIWNYIESAVAYGTPQTGKRWGTYDAAAGSAGSFTTPGVTPGGVNIGVDLSGWGGPDETHMAGDIQDTAFESDTVSGVHNGNSSASFGTQYTMGGAAEVAGMLPAGTVPAPAPTMDQTVADWWGATAPPVPDATTGATSGGPSASGGGPSASGGGGQKVNIKMNANTGSKGGGGKSKSGNITQTQNITGSSSAPAASGQGSPAGASGVPGGSGGGGGTLMDGVQNFMTALPAVTQDYLQNVGQQTLGTAGQFNMAPLGNTLDDWIIAALEGAGLDPTPEAIATMSALATQESGGDPNAVSPDGAQGLFQLMPDTWSAYNAGGDVWDPVANGIASINYQLARYGQLVDFSPYAKGGVALGAHLGMVGEAGAEAMVPLENKAVMSQFRANLGMDGMDEALAHLSQRIDYQTERIDYQTGVLPARTGNAVKSGVDHNLERNPATQRAKARGEEHQARREYVAG